MNLAPLLLARFGSQRPCPQFPSNLSPYFPPTESVEQKFQRLAAAWRAETVYVSSTSDLIAHPAFQEIVGMGSVVIPLLLRELANRIGHWHRALWRITGVDPVAPADRRNMDKTAAGWLRWGKEQGYER